MDNEQTIFGALLFGTLLLALLLVLFWVVSFPISIQDGGEFLDLPVASGAVLTELESSRELRALGSVGPLLPDHRPKLGPVASSVRRGLVLEKGPKRRVYLVIEAEADDRTRVWVSADEPLDRRPVMGALRRDFARHFSD